MRYERLFALGSGGMASVELALAVGPSGFNRLVVLKSTRKELAGSEDAYTMFLDEARLSARLNHPNVVHLSEVLDTPDGVVLVMEYLDGLSLAGAYRAANNALTLPMRLRVMCDVLAGLHYAHELSDFSGRPLGIVHRDVSPQNVFLTYDGRVKLLDFGIAKATSTEQTRAGMVKGRIAYMPAEQLTAGTVDRRTDVYSVGCLLWEAIAGGRIWQDQTDRDIARGVLTGQIPPLSSRVTVDADLERIVAKATAFAPNQRYATAELMRLDIERYLASRGVQVTARDIGEMLSNISSAAREQRQRAIAEAIAGLGLDNRDGTSTGPRRSVSAVRRIHAAASQAATESGTPQRMDDGVGAPSSASPPPTAVPDSMRSDSTGMTTRRPKRSRLPLFVALVGVIAVGAFFGFGRYAAQQNAETKSASPVAPVATAHTLTVATRPSDARVFVDGSEVPGNPAVVKVPAGSEHSVRVERDGYESSERSVKVSEEMSLSVDLVAKAEPSATSSAREKAKSGTRGAQPRAVAPAVAPRAPAPAEKNCDPPFYFVNGNKTYKPECI
jgi:serine/threonine protein kinase